MYENAIKKVLDLVLEHIINEHIQIKIIISNFII